MSVLFFETPLVVLSAVFLISGVQRHYSTFPLNSLPLLQFLPDPCGSLVPLTLVTVQGWGSASADFACPTSFS